ncbi:MAG: O-succinylbenzoic acid--CoA ligase [Bacteroidetes bacterium HGW-Bacteroidetes-1]|jgi:O-succinylbenzoic acid--CoA ligase|nr:MAG: O-succinylbenzoic acid--CoA ligase [Bacteroidetes bacterium HGW-Bacteroidetes-1]
MKVPETLTLNGIHHTKEMLMKRIENQCFESDLLLKEVFTFLAFWLDGKPTIEVKTSGSTGTPKFLLVEKEQMLQSALLTTTYFDLKPNMNALLCLSPAYIAGKMMIVRSMVANLNLITTNVTSYPLAAIESKIDFAAMVPFQFIKTYSETPEKLTKISTIILGGSGLNPAITLAAEKITTSVFHTYGMTETLSHIALRAVNGPEKSDWFTPFDGIDISLDYRECLMINAPMLSKKKLITNDIAILDENNCFRILGRYDDVIITAGIKIHPNMIETKIVSTLRFPFAIVPVEDDKAGQLPFLVIEQTLSLSEVYDLWMQLMEHLTEQEVPRQIVSIEPFPLLESGKIDRRAISNMLKQKF